MQQGGGSIGAKKHGVSGHPGTSPRNRFLAKQKANRQLEEERLYKGAY